MWILIQWKLIPLPPPKTQHWKLRGVASFSVWWNKGCGLDFTWLTLNFTLLLFYFINFLSSSSSSSPLMLFVCCVISFFQLSLIFNYYFFTIIYSSSSSVSFLVPRFLMVVFSVLLLGESVLDVSPVSELEGISWVFFFFSTWSTIFLGLPVVSNNPNNTANVVISPPATAGSSDAALTGSRWAYLIKLRTRVLISSITDAASDAFVDSWSYHHKDFLFILIFFMFSWSL